MPTRQDGARERGQRQGSADALDQAPRAEAIGRPQAWSARRDAILAAAARHLVGNLDEESALQAIVRVPVPALGDYCLLDIVEESGGVRRLVAHHDRVAEALLEGLGRHIPPGHPSSFLVAVMRDRRATLLADLPALAAGALPDDGLLRTLALLGATAAIGVPLEAGGEVFGAALIVSVGAGGAYGEEEVALADELFGRCAAALASIHRLRRAEVAASQQSDLLSQIAHDLKQPLAAVATRAEDLRQRVEPLGLPREAGLAEGLDRIGASTRRMTRMLNELVDAARLRAGSTLELRRRPIDLVTLARSVAAEFGYLAPRLVVRIEAEAGEVVGNWDPFRIERALLNVVDNAVKYSPGGGEVVIAIREEETEAGRWAVAEVRDRGIGIPAADRPHVLRRFRRASNVPGRVAGTGLGLWGAARTVEEHGGELSLASEEGVGTTVVLRLPLEGGEPSGGRQLRPTEDR